MKSHGTLLIRGTAGYGTGCFLGCASLAGQCATRSMRRTAWCVLRKNKPTGVCQPGLLGNLLETRVTIPESEM